jgi:membrane protease YdiL (CAAX protease family)
MRSGRDIPGRDDQNDDSAEPSGPATFPADALRPALVGIATTVLAAWTVGALLPKGATPVFVVVYYLVFGGLIRTAVTASARWGSGNLRADFGWWARPSDLLRGVVVAYAGAAAGGLALTFWPDGWTTNAEWLTSADGLTVAVFAVFAVVAAPLFEELVFRGLLQRALTSRYGARTAIVVQGIVFGLYHLRLDAGADNLANVVYIGVWGMVVGFAAHRWRRLGPGMAAHALTNILVTAAIITG